MAVSIGCAVLSMGFVLVQNTHKTAQHVPAGGTIFIDNQPVAQADVILLPTAVSEKVKSYHGHSDAQGQYEIFGGLPAGEYRVVVRTNEVLQLPSAGGVTYQPGEIDAGQMQAMQSAAEVRNSASRQSRRTTVSKKRTPPSYSSAATTTLRVVIPKWGIANSDLHLQTSEDSRIAAKTQATSNRQ